jgi:hypothetical protein
MWEHSTGIEWARMHACMHGHDLESASVPVLALHGGVEEERAVEGGVAGEADEVVQRLVERDAHHCAAEGVLQQLRVPACMQKRVSVCILGVRGSMEQCSCCGADRLESSLIHQQPKYIQPMMLEALA